MPGTLYLVATPIGNLKDITLRAIDVLKSVDLIACEDTRHTRKLLNHYQITARMVSYHEHNERTRAVELTEKLVGGQNIAVVSDAGTPGICDPSFRLVTMAKECGITVTPIPGAVAFVSAVVASGISSDSLFFCGFLPSKKSDRIKRLTELQEIPATLVFYEAPHRLVRSLADCLEVLGNRQAAVAREISKIHEEIILTDLKTLYSQYSATIVKGEIVLVVERARELPKSQDNASITDRIAELERSGEDRKSALKKAAKEFGISKSEAYRLVQMQKTN